MILHDFGSVFRIAFIPTNRWGDGPGKHWRYSTFTLWQWAASTKTGEHADAADSQESEGRRLGDDCLNGTKPSIPHLVVAGQGWMQSIGNVRDIEHMVHVEEKHLLAQGALCGYHSGNCGVVGNRPRVGVTIRGKVIVCIIDRRNAGND